MQITPPIAQLLTQPAETSAPASVLAIESSSASLSIALAHGEHVVQWQGAGGAQASAQIINQIKNALVSASITIKTIDVIAFGCGPGAFTGLRTACAVTQGLAFAAAKPVLPVTSLLSLAEAARAAFGATQVLALLDARMGEVYWAAYLWQPDLNEWHVVQPPIACAPQQVALPAGFEGWVAAGAAWQLFAEQLPTKLQSYAFWLDALPHAAHLLAPARRAFARGEALSAEHASPLYVRDNVAQTIAERSISAQKRLNAAAGPL